MSPTPEQIAALYDFPGIFEVALKGLFTARGIKAFTTQSVESTGDVMEDQALVEMGFEIIDFQRDRPRVEILFTPGAGQGQYRPLQVTEDQEFPVETSWNGQYKIDVLTLPDIRVHRAFVTAVRFILHTQLYTLNGNFLDKHRVQVDYKDAGTTPAMQPDKGSFQTTMLFDLDFSIQEDAWADLAALLPDIVPQPPPIAVAIDDTDGDPLVDTNGDVLGGN